MRTDRWVQILILDHSADPEAAEKAVEAIAAFLAHLEEEGASRRKTSGVRSDLQAASHLVFSYDAPGPESVLNAFSSPPWVFEFKHKYIDSSRRVKRYERHTRAFADFLESYEHDG